MINEQQRRWRLLLGNMPQLTPELNARDLGMDAALAALYNQGDEGEEQGFASSQKSKQRQAGLGVLRPKSAVGWVILGNIFPPQWSECCKKMLISD